jgi:hypothetical protein
VKGGETPGNHKKKDLDKAIKKSGRITIELPPKPSIYLF